MNFSKQSTFANDVFADEVSSADYRKLCKLLETILAQTVSNEVHQVCKEQCCGCEYDHPSQRRHDCIMLTTEEKWLTYGLEAIERVNGKHIIWHLFLEAVRVLKLKYHNGIVDHLRDLEREPDSALENSLSPGQTRKHCCGNIVSCQRFAMFPKVGKHWETSVKNNI